MIHRIVDWFLYILHLKKRPIGKLAIESLIDILPIVIAAGIIVGAVKSLKLDLPIKPWYKRYWFRIKHTIRHYRMVIVGY